MVQLNEVNRLLALSFLECGSYTALANYTLALYGLPNKAFRDQRVNYFQHSLLLHKPCSASVKKRIDIPLLNCISVVFDTM